LALNTSAPFAPRPNWKGYLKPWTRMLKKLDKAGIVLW
jgi:hypothetical protein